MKQTTKRFVSMLGGLTLLVSAMVVYFEFITPVYSEVQNIKSKQIGSGRFLLSEQETIEKVRDLISSYEGQIKVQEFVSMALPSGDEDVPGALAQVYGLSKNSGLAMQSIGISAANPLGSPDGKTAVAFSLQKPVGKISFNLRVNGSYEDLKGFLSLLETNIRIFDLVSVGVQPLAGEGGAPRDFYGYDINVVAYYQSN